MNLHVVTRCTRPENLRAVHESFKDNVLTWHVVFDVSVVYELDSKLLYWLYSVANVYFKQSEPGSYMYPLINELIKTELSFSLDDFVTLIDDDNIVHPDYYKQIIAFDKEYNASAYCYNQLVDVNTGAHRIATKENTIVGGIDLAQYTVRVSAFEFCEFGSGYCGDGEFIQALHNSFPNDFLFINETLCYYNYLQQVAPKKTSAPNILYVGKDKPELKSQVHLGYEDTSLNVEYADKSDLVSKDYDLSKYDAIITTEKDWKDIPLLPTESSIIRSRWVNVEQADGELAYNVAMNSILTPIVLRVSFFTPVYKTPLERLIRLHSSIVNQTTEDWEWVIVNDSPKDGKLSEFLDLISQSDARIKVFTFDKPSNGCIGDVKYKSASLCIGELLAEVDHDDELLPNCAQLLIDASNKHKECGFFYTNCVELDDNRNSMTYPDGFAFGYGKYRKNGNWDESICVGINPKTIRHIVGVPNHIRAWRRSVYNAIGGHNRRLTIADDYELIVRTFLYTKFCHIDALGYIQYIYNNHTGQNTHDATRGDIQRRVRTIMYHYNHDIAQRFFELGVDDWAYADNPTNPLLAKSRFGKKEKSVNVIYSPNM